MSHADLQMEHIKDVAATSFDYFVLFWWEGKESLLRDIQDKGRAAACTELTPVSGFAKLQSFRETALHTAGYCWAWIDMCFIDRTNNAELQQLVNFMMFIWYRHSAPTIVYLSDVLPSSEPDSSSAWNTRGWTFQEFLAPKINLPYQQDWTLYPGDRSPNHKNSVAIMQLWPSIHG